MDIKCLFGFHSYDQMEIHVTEKMTAKPWKTAILMRCSKCRYAKVGNPIDTLIVIPHKYAPDNMIIDNESGGEG